MKARILADSQREATERGHSYVAIAHLVLAALRTADPITATRRARGRLDFPELYRRVDQFVLATEGARSTNSRFRAAGPPRLTSHAQRQLDAAQAEASRRGHAEITPYHILASLFEPIGARFPEADQLRTLLEDRGLVADRVLESLGDAPSGIDARVGFRFAIDDDSELPIYEQIVRQVQQGLITGQLALGDRLPAVRQLADRLEIAPGTVARAYSQLERRGLVKSDGVKGTRIVAERRWPSPDANTEATIVERLRSVAIMACCEGVTAPTLRELLREAMIGIYQPTAE